MATANQISAQKLEEDRRHNRRTEEQEDLNRKQRDKLNMRDNVTRTFNNATNVGGKLIGSINDPSWYNKVPNLVKDSASFSFAAPLGDGVSKLTIHGGTPIPFIGGAILNFIPTVGSVGSSANNSIQDVARALYTSVRKNNSGGANYEAPELLMYVLSVSLALETWAECARAYSILKTYKTRNRYFGSKLAQALGFDPSLTSNLANFREKINEFALKLNAFAIPANIPLIRRWIWLGGSIFKDADVDKSQNYYFTTRIYPKYNSTVGAIEYVLKPTSLTLANVTSMLDTITESILNNSDLGNIAGDIMKRFSDHDLMSVPQLSEDYHIESVYSAEVLTQINGATVTGQVFMPTGSNLAAGINQSPTGVISTGTFNKTATTDAANPFSVKCGYFTSATTTAQFKQDVGTFYSAALVNMYKDDVSPDDVMVATRLMATLKTELQGTTYVLLVDNTGTEFIESVSLFINNLDPSEPIFDVTPFNNGFLFNASYSSSEQQTATLSNAGYYQLDWAPQAWKLVQVAEGSQALGQINYVYPLFDIQNYSILSGENLGTMHTVAFSSELALVDWVSNGRIEVTQGPGKKKQR